MIIQMELFNSKINHPDYMCDNSAWGIELCQRLDSPNFKLLYDIYHMQISEGTSLEPFATIINTLVIIIPLAFQEDTRLMKPKNYFIQRL